MSLKDIHGGAIQVLRERLFINHKTPEIREIISELTLINNADEEIHDLFLIRKAFMEGLKIHDANDRELVVFPNEVTKKLFGKFTNRDSRGPTIYNIILDKMRKHEIFVLWIKLPEDSGLTPKTPTIIKFVYKDKSSPRRIQLEESLYDEKFLFSIPRFSVEEVKDEGLKHDIFCIIQAPENYELEYNIVTKTLFTGSYALPLEKKQGFYDEKNGKKRFISIRIPPFKEKIEFAMFYDVLPKKSDRDFHLRMLIALTGIAIFVSLISTGKIPTTEINIMKQIFDNANSIFGGITTASLAIIGIFRDPIYHRLRYWFTIPIIISAIGFLWNIKPVT